MSRSDGSASSEALVDAYFLEGEPTRAELISRLLAVPAKNPAALPFYEGFRILGGRTPDLSLIALRLVLAGKRVDDAAVTQLRAIVDRLRAEGAEAERARSEYRALLGV